MKRPSIRAAFCALLALAALPAAFPVAADTVPPQNETFAHGAPAEPSEAWTIAAGGRLYDNWWLTLDKPAPKTRNPAYPAAGKAKDTDTWRCKECHGWDYLGRDGDYATGSHATGIKGLRDVQGRPPADLEKILRGRHRFLTADILSDVELGRLALFLSKGQHDISAALQGRPGKSTGSASRGKDIYQTTCAACHGFDGRLLNWGSEKEPEYIGTSANVFPEEFLHKARNGHTGAVMINLRAFPMQDAIDVHAYAQTLPVK